MLQTVARRPRDVVARFGGEEFTLLLPETDEATARKLAEKCARGIAMLRMPYEKSSISPFVTASIGIETAVADAGNNPRNFVEEVDRMLYAAKHNGRNRIEVATP